MAATRNQISDWFDEGREIHYSYMIIVCDTYDHSDYAVYVGNNEEEFQFVYVNITRKAMTRIMEVYDLNLDKEIQMNEYRAFHYPPNWKGE